MNVKNVNVTPASAEKKSKNKGLDSFVKIYNSKNFMETLLEQSSTRSKAKDGNQQTRHSSR
jgi:hypothetical protein